MTTMTLTSSSHGSIDIRAVCGLGNPGPEYASTRHNIGFMVAHLLAKRLGVKLLQRECLARSTGWISAHGKDLVIFTPQTYMNRSGSSVAAMIARYDLDPANILVIHDDADLPFGRLRFRPRGGSGGVGGLESIIELLRTREFPRLRLGVSNESRGREIHDFILDDFSPEEAAGLDKILDAAEGAVECVIQNGMAAAMNTFNRAQDVL